MSKTPAQKRPSNQTKKPDSPEVPEQTPLHTNEHENHQELNPSPEDLNINKSQHIPQQQEQEEEVIPEDKDELIEYLKSKLHKTQSTIQEALGVLEEEKEMTGKLAGDFDTKKREITKIQQDQNRSIREKVHEKVETTLQRVVSEKVEAEARNVEMKACIGEKEMLIKELEWSLKGLQIENTEKEYELQELRDKNAEQTRLLEALKNKKIKMEEEGAEQEEQIKRLLKEKDDTKGAILKLTDVKNVLNRLLSDPAALYGHSSEVVGKDREHVPKETSSQPMQSQTSKPTYLANEDDFWYGADPAKQPYAKDYGGREKNYNQRYNHNTKVQNAPGSMGDSPSQGQEGFEGNGAKGFSPANSMRTSKKKVY